MAFYQPYRGLNLAVRVLGGLWSVVRIVVMQCSGSLVGVAEIDRQHEALRSRVKWMLTTLHDGCSGDDVAQMIAFLQEYASKHIRAEEALMAATGYPKQQEHMQAHRDFVNAMKQLQTQFANGGECSGTDVEAVRSWVVQWLDTHMESDDRALGDFLRGSRGITSE